MKVKVFKYGLYRSRAFEFSASGVQGFGASADQRALQWGPYSSYGGVGFGVLGLGDKAF